MARKKVSVSFDAERLRNLMTEKAINQIQLSEALGYTRGTINRCINTGEAEPHLLNKIAEYLNVSEQYLKDETDNPSRITGIVGKIAGLQSDNKKSAFQCLKLFIQFYLSSKNEEELSTEEKNLLQLIQEMEEIPVFSELFYAEVASQSLQAACEYSAKLRPLLDAFIQYQKGENDNGKH